MLCPNCQSEFNTGANLPRILIFCGHTFCHSCIEQLLSSSQDDNCDKQKQLNCPECKVLNIATNGVDSFPKNLVLLQVNTLQQQQPSTNQLNDQQKEAKYQMAQPAQSSARSSNFKQLCQLHGKKLEAFCEKDLQVLCIDCILSEQHKSHEIVSVQKAVERQKQYLYDEVNAAAKTEERLKFIYSDIKRHISDMHNQAEKNRREISLIYNFVREILLEREQLLKRQISDNLQKEEQDNHTKLSELSEFMGKIGNLKGELICQSQESEIELLYKARTRQLQCQELNGQRSRELAAISIMSIANNSPSLHDIKREQELGQISKIISLAQRNGGGNSAFNQIPSQNNGCSNNPLSQQPNSTLYSHTLASKMKRSAANPNQQANNNPNISGGNYPILQKESSNKESNAAYDRRMQEDMRKISKNNQIKSKVSPNRVQTSKKLDQQQAQSVKNKNGVVVLDQNRQKAAANKQKSYNANYSNPAQQNINLYNYNQQNQVTDHQLSNEDSEDVIASGMNADDVSSIYPMDTNECYFQYSPRHNGIRGNNINNPEQCQKLEIKRDESVGALKDLLESLNKSDGACNEIIGKQSNGSQANLLLPRESSTASETAGSNSDQNQPADSKAPKSNIETPRSKKINPWMANNRQKSISNKKRAAIANQENCNSDIEEYTHTNQIQTPKKNFNPSHQYYQLEESKSGIHRSGSLQKYNTNSLINTSVNQSIKEREERIISDAKQHRSSHKSNLMSLSQERNKRKIMKADHPQGDDYTPQQQEQFKSPQKESDEYDSPDKFRSGKQDLMVMLQECTKNIEKLEFRPSAKKKQKKLEVSIIQDSPSKLGSVMNQKPATVCLVDLSAKDESQVDPQQKNQDDNAYIPILDDEDSQIKNLPNHSKQKEQSPFKQLNQSCDQQPTLQNEIKFTDSNVSSPLKEKGPCESFDKIISQFSQKNEGHMSSKNQSSAALGVSQSISNMSVDTSVADPFRALCRVKEEFIFVFSGFNDQKLLICEALDVQRGVWKEICQISKARTKFAAVPISKSRILLFGGKLADGQRTGEIEEYNLKTNKFKTLPFKLPKPRSGFAACVKREEGKIFFCGGNSGAVLKKFDCLDLKKGKWSRWPEMLQKRDELAVALGPDGKIYAIGGYGGGSVTSNNNQTENDSTNEGSAKTQSSSSSNCLRTAERFDFNTGQWEMLPEMNEARRALAAVALPDGIYAIGGYDGRQYLSSVEKFDLQKQQWITVKSMNTSRCTLSAVASTDCQYIYALGGFNGNSLDLVERYNIMTDEWEFVTPMNSKRFMHEAVCLITH